MPELSVSKDFIPFPDSRFGAILADPPWAFRTYSNKGLGKSAQANYDCLDLGDMTDWNIGPRLAANNCALFMWATFPMLPQALDLMAAWGFTYKTGGSWAKKSKTGRKLAFGTGYIFRSASELLLVGTMGKPAWGSKSERNLWIENVREHSRKPDAIHEMIERLAPAPRLELFARAPREGWTVWGNQTERFIAAEAL